MKFIIKNTENVMGLGIMAAALEKMTGKNDDKFYDFAVTKLAKMENIGQLEAFSINGKIVTVIRIG